MANLTVYLPKVANLRTVDHHLRYPGNLRRPCVTDIVVDSNARGRGLGLVIVKGLMRQGLTVCS